jgi:hypothetical protein
MVPSHCQTVPAVPLSPLGGCSGLHCEGNFTPKSYVNGSWIWNLQEIVRIRYGREDGASVMASVSLRKQN